MRLSDDQVSHFTSRIAEELKAGNLIILKKSMGDLRQTIARVFRSELSKEAAIDAEVRRKLASYSRRIVEGSSEWQVMYQQHFTEAQRRRGLR